MAAFVYRDGDDVPPDVIRVVVHPSVRILPPKAFSGRRKLEEVQLHEGLEEIGHGAFYGCVSLRRLNYPSSLLRIGALAFMGCTKLEEVKLKEGLEKIGDAAFYGCISLRRLNCPSTVVRIEARAFVGCWKLSVVELAGIVKVEMGAFSPGFTSMERIGIPSRAFVAKLCQQRTYRNYTCHLVTDGSIARTSKKLVLIAPGCLTVLPYSTLREVGTSIGMIMNHSKGTDEDRLDRARQVVRKEVQGEVSGILGLAFWRAKIDEAERARIGAASDRRKNAGGGRKRDEGDAVLTRKARERCRGSGKGKVIAENVLPFLDGLWCKGLQGGP